MTPPRRPRASAVARAGLRLLTLLPVAALALAGSGCASTGPQPHQPDDEIPGGVLITRAQIEASGARHALEALQRARTHLYILGDLREGSAPRIIHRGMDSTVGDGGILVVVDGTPMRGSSHALIDIPAASIEFMKVLSSREATMRYGTLAGNGVVYVRTSNRASN